MLPLQGCVSLMNILLGIGLLSMPYSLSLSGGAGLLLVAVVCVLFNASGKFIAWGLDLLPDSTGSHIKARPSLPHSAWPEPEEVILSRAVGSTTCGDSGSCLSWEQLHSDQAVPYMFAEKLNT